MKNLIIGQFIQHADAEAAARDLIRSGFPTDDMSLFYVAPQGQHDLHPVGGDEDESAGTHHAPTGAMQGAVGGVGVGSLVGIATIPVFGPAGPLMGAVVGAYAGSLVGALKNMDQDELGNEVFPDLPVNAAASSVDDQPRKSGLLLAVAVATPEQRENAIQSLSKFTPVVEEAEGELEHGQWLDFNPLKPIRHIDNIGAMPNVAN